MTDQRLLKIERAFLARAMPEDVTDRDQSDPDYSDAMAFSGRGWEEVSIELWKAHSSSFYAFTPEAWAYYLQSLLRIDTQDEDELEVIDSLITCMDRSPRPEYWDDFFLSRLGSLRRPECEVLRDWLVETKVLGPYDEITSERVMSTADLLIKQSQPDCNKT